MYQNPEPPQTNPLAALIAQILGRVGPQSLPQFSPESYSAAHAGLSQHFAAMNPSLDYPAQGNPNDRFIPPPGYVSAGAPGGGVGGPAAVPAEEGPQGIVYGYRNGQTFMNTPAGRVGYQLAPQAGAHQELPPARVYPIRPLSHQVIPSHNVRAKPISGVGRAIIRRLLGA
jgi:hypothetical protein